MTIAHGRKFFDNSRCSDPSCHEPHSGELFVHAACHPGAPLHAMYEHGAFYFYCDFCLTFITAAALAVEDRDVPNEGNKAKDLDQAHAITRT